MKILICEDENSIRSFLKINFERNGFNVIEAETGEEALRLAELEKPIVVVLDVMLPGISGFEVCKKLRKKYPDIGIIMLTAKGQDIDKIEGLKYGADDYVVKPFNPIEFILRTKALIRRLEDSKESSENKNIIETNGFIIDKYSKTTMMFFGLIGVLFIEIYGPSLSVKIFFLGILLIIFLPFIDLIIEGLMEK